MGNFNRGNNSRDGYHRKFGRDFGGHGNFNRGGRPDRQMHKAVCSNCGIDCEVPFHPTGDKPVYCSDCFEKMGGKANRNTYDKPRHTERRPEDDLFKAQLEMVNSKLDTILNLLQPKTNTDSSSTISESVEVPVKKIKAKSTKTKKSAKEKAPVDKKKLEDTSQKEFSGDDEKIL